MLRGEENPGEQEHRPGRMLPQCGRRDAPTLTERAKGAARRGFRGGVMLVLTPDSSGAVHVACCQMRENGIRARSRASK